MTNPDYHATTQWWRKATESTGQASLIAMVRASVALQQPDMLAEINFQPECDKAAFDYRVPHGRADLAVFHGDGSLTLVEMKDGRAGALSVLCGIGQVTMYALNVSIAAASSKSLKRKVGKALLWNSTGDLLQDALIAICCEEADVVPIQFGPLEPQLACARLALEKIGNGA